MTRIIIFVFIIIFSSFKALPCWALPVWDLKQTYESKALITSPFSLFTSADVNKNGIKELIVADFGRFGDHIEEWKQWRKDFSHYKLMILEWDKNDLKLKFHKQWDTSKAETDAEAHKFFMAYEALQMVSWQVGERVLVETIPPYLGIEWQNGKYVLHEQQGSAQNTPLVGSWVFPWLSPSCYQSFPKKITWPRECLAGIRDYSRTGEPKIVTILENEIGFNQYKQTLRVRSFKAGFPIEWEMASSTRFAWWSPGWQVYVDRLNQRGSNSLKMSEFRSSKWYFLDQENNSKSYRLRQVPCDSMMGIVSFDLPDIYIRSTQKMGKEEFWGVRQVGLSDPNSVSFIVVLRKVTLNSDLRDVAREDIDFPHHKSYLGVGYFDLQDIDGDGLDEIILVEETAGKLTFGEETVHYGDIKDYIHILKWNGSKYQDMWVSPPYTKRGTKLLVDDIKTAGKKQLVVLTPYGTVQIWERQ